MNEIPSADDYAARFAGFVHQFIKGACLSADFPNYNELDRDTRDVLFDAARVAWEDRLIRERRAESRREKAGFDVRVP